MQPREWVCRSPTECKAADPGLVALCKRCLSPEKADRPADGGEVARAVAALRAAADERARRAERDRAAAAAEAREQRKRRRVQLALAGAVGLLLLAGGGFAWWQDRQAADRRLADEVRAAQEARVRDGVEAALTGLPELYQRGLWKRAEAAPTDADALLGPDGDPALRERLAVAQRDTAFVARLDRARLDAVQFGRSSDVEGRQIAARFAAAFRDHGWEVMDGDIADLARRLAASPVRDHLLAALDGWAFHGHDRPDEFRRLFAVTAAATGHAWRRDLADAWASADSDRLAAVYDAIPPGQRSASIVAAVGLRLRRTDGGRRLEDGLRQYPTDLWLHYMTALGWLDERPDRALGGLRAALAIRPDSPVLLNSVGITLGKTGDADGSAWCFREAIRLDPGYFEPHGNLGVLLEDRGDYAGAEDAYRAAVRCQPDNAEVHTNLGNALTGKGDPAGAEAAYREAIRLDADQADAHNGLGIILLAGGDPAGAEAAYRKAVRADPDHAQAHYNLASLLRDRGDPTAAETEYRRAIRSDPNFPEPHCNLGWLLHGQGRLAEALELFRKGHELGRKRKDWAYPSGDWVKECERLVALEPRLPAIRAGADRPTPAEAVALAVYVQNPSNRGYELSLWLYADAFAAAPALAGVHRYNAACTAVRLAAGDDPSAVVGWDEGFAALDGALGWLSADLAEYRRLARSTDVADRERAAHHLSHWRRDPDLALIREPARRAWMPAPDRERWEKFWAEVEAVRASALPPVAPPPREAGREGSLRGGQEVVPAGGVENPVGQPVQPIAVRLAPDRRLDRDGRQPEPPGPLPQDDPPGGRQRRPGLPHRLPLPDGSLVDARQLYDLVQAHVQPPDLLVVVPQPAQHARPAQHLVPQRTRHVGFPQPAPEPAERRRQVGVRLVGQEGQRGQPRAGRLQPRDRFLPHPHHLILEPAVHPAVGPDRLVGAGLVGRAGLRPQ